MDKKALTEDTVWEWFRTRNLDGMVEAAIADAHITVLEFFRSRERHATRARHRFWAMLVGRGFSHNSVAKVFLVDHTSVIRGVALCAKD